MCRLTRPSRRWFIVLVLLALALPLGSGSVLSQSGGVSELPPPSAPADDSPLPLPGMSAIFPISPMEASFDQNVQVAYDTQHHEYMVIWESQHPGGSPSSDIRGQRVSRTGQLLGPSFVIFSAAGHDSTTPSIAYDPVHDQFLVVWEFKFSDSDHDIYGRLIPWDGPIGPMDFLSIATSGTFSDSTPRVAYALWASAYLVVWTSKLSNDPSQAPWITTRQVPYDGVMKADAVTLMSTDRTRWNPDIVYNPNLLYNEFLITYENELSADRTVIKGFIVNPDGSWKSPAELTIEDYWTNQFRPAAATCGSGYAVIHEANTNPPNWGVYMQMLDTAGARVGLPIQVADTTGDESGGRIVCGGRFDRYAIAWSNMYAGGAYGVRGRLASKDGALGPAFGIVNPTGAYDRKSPAIAGDTLTEYGYGFLVAWEHDALRTGSYVDVYGRLLLTETTFLPLVQK
jgi:hypothetical protein